MRMRVQNAARVTQTRASARGPGPELKGGNEAMACGDSPNTRTFDSIYLSLQLQAGKIPGQMWPIVTNHRVAVEAGLGRGGSSGLERPNLKLAISS